MTTRMRRLGFGPGQEKSREGLGRFVEECRQEAKAAGDWRLVSISLRVGSIDPLEVLEAIFEPEESHFYLEKVVENRAVAGAEAVVEFSCSGAERFVEARRFMESVLARTICIEETGEAFFGPHFFFNFSFLDAPVEASDFPGVSGFVPRWQVTRRADLCVATANMRVDPDSDSAALAERVWRAHLRFSTFTGGRTGESDGRDGNRITYPNLLDRQEVVSRSEFEAGVAGLLEEIEAGSVRKVVLARPIDLRFSGNLQPLQALTRLREGYSNCFTFSTGNGRGAHFIGASPELLVRRQANRLETEALAGSAPRGKSAGEDSALAQALENSGKDRHEHQLVVEAILRRLGRFPIRLAEPEKPRLLQLANVQHLRTALSGTIDGDVDLLAILEALHPTPAVGGTPRAEAAALIRLFEKLPRGLYAGAIGWIDSSGNGEFTVPIRSVLIKKNEARLFVGAGIVAGSDPAREWEETEVKSRPVLDALSGRRDAG